MKITEIIAINEAAAAKAAAVGKAAFNQMAGQLKAAPAKAAPAAAPAVVVPKTKDPASLFSWIDKYIERRADRAAVTAAATEKYTARAGVIGKALNILGAGALIVNGIMKLDTVEQLYQSGQIDEQRYHEARQWYIGMFGAQILIPFLVSKLGVIRGAAWIVRLIVSIATGAVTLGGTIGSAGIAAAPAVAALIAEQAFFTFLQGFLASEAGAEFLSKYVGMPILEGGAIFDGAWDYLTDHYKKSADKKATAAPKTGGTSATATTKPADEINWTSDYGTKASTAATAADAEQQRQNASAVRIAKRDPATGKLQIGITDPKTGKFIPDPDQ